MYMNRQGRFRPCCHQQPAMRCDILHSKTLSSFVWLDGAPPDSFLAIFLVLENTLDILLTIKISFSDFYRNYADESCDSMYRELAEDYTGDGTDLNPRGFHKIIKDILNSIAPRVYYFLKEYRQPFLTTARHLLSKSGTLINLSPCGSFVVDMMVNPSLGSDERFQSTPNCTH